MKCGYPPTYVLDNMEVYEMNAALKYSYYSHKDTWEQARFVAYVVAQTQSTKKINMEEMLKFHWEKDNEEKSDTTITKEQIELLKAQAQQYLKTQNKTVERRNNG